MTVNPLPQIDPETLEAFAFVCDGEVAEIIKLPPTNQRFIAVLQSNPVIVKVEKGQQVTWGDLYVDGKFVKPQ